MRTNARVSLIRISGLAAAGMGVLALSGWALRLPRLASLGAGLVPMAPSTALLFLAFGGALALCAREPLARRVRVWCATLVALGSVAALALGVAAAQGVRWDGEHLGFSPLGAVVAEIPVGHMSPVTAGFFVLAGMSFLASLLGAGRLGSIRMAQTLAGILLPLSGALLLLYVLGEPLLYGGSAIPPAATTLLAFAALGSGLWLLASRQSAPQDERPASRSNWIFTFCLFALGIVTVGYASYRHDEREHRTALTRQITAIADLKLRQVVGFRQERIGDGSVFLGNLAFSHLVRRTLAGSPDTGAQQELLQWLTRFHASHECERVMLLDERGALRLSIPASSAPPTYTIPGPEAEILQSGGVALQDFFWDEHERQIYLAVLVPLFDGMSPRQRLGTLVLRIDPRTYLYPYIALWPTLSQTAETLLIRRDGDEVLFLNPLKFQEDAALNRRIPLTRQDVPAVMAVRGKVGAVEGVDYRGEPVLADLRAIPDSPWFLVARMDTAEAYAPLRDRRSQIALAGGILILALGAGMGMVWRGQSVRFFKEQYQAAERLRESDQKFRALYEHMSEGVAFHELVYGPDEQAIDYRILSVNPAYQTHTGIAPERALGQRAGTVYGTAVPPYLDDFAHVARTGEPIAFETYFAPLQKHFSISVVCPRPGQFVTVFKDITKRRQRENRLRELNDELARFNYTVSHDLKSPLVTIRTFAGYLEQDIRTADAEAMTKDLAFIRGAAEKMSRLLDELLDFSRVGRKMNPAVEVSLQAIVQEVLGLVAGRIAGRKVQLTVTQEPVLLFGDRPRLVAVFQNLVDNAVKFMGDQAAPLVEIGIEPAGDEVVFFVRDNGKGIDPRHQAKLFGLFEKLDAGSEGTGMGLALARRVVEVHGGRIWAESAGLGQGATFRFTLAETKRASA